jgi:hypothetical protein
MMKWIKKGVIFKPDGNYEWSRTHAQVPFPLLLENQNLLRIFFATRNANSQSSTSFIDVNPENPSEIINIHDKPSLTKGKQGCFDDSGAMPSWFLYHNNKLYLYYTGWNTSDTASYRLAIGLAVSKDHGETFERVYEGPILDRGPFDQVWVAQPCVMKDGSKWKMWYLSCTKIELVNNHPEPFYNVKYAESTDGINWVKTSDIAIGYDDFTDAIGRPFVYREGDIYKMIYSFRNSVDYRINPDKSYRLGYAESLDGIKWERKDHLMQIEKSTDDWDSLMLDYCSTYFYNENQYLIYNGNGFGASGFGYAVLKDRKF